MLGFLCVSFCVGVLLLVNESKNSVAMASVLFTGCFHCKGRPGVILGSLKELQYIPVCAIIFLWTILPRY